VQLLRVCNRGPADMKGWLADVKAGFSSGGLAFILFLDQKED